MLLLVVFLRILNDLEIHQIKESNSKDTPLGTNYQDQTFNNSLIINSTDTVTIKSCIFRNVSCTTMISLSHCKYSVVIDNLTIKDGYVTKNILNFANVNCSKDPKNNSVVINRLDIKETRFDQNSDASFSIFSDASNTVIGNSTIEFSYNHYYPAIFLSNQVSNATIKNFTGKGLSNFHSSKGDDKAAIQIEINDTLIFENVSLRYCYFKQPKYFLLIKQINENSTIRSNFFYDVDPFQQQKPGSFCVIENLTNNRLLIENCTFDFLNTSQSYTIVLSSITQGHISIKDCHFYNLDCCGIINCENFTGILDINESAFINITFDSMTIQKGIFYCPYLTRFILNGSYFINLNEEKSSRVNFFDCRKLGAIIYFYNVTFLRVSLSTIFFTENETDTYFELCRFENSIFKNYFIFMNQTANQGLHDQVWSKFSCTNTVIYNCFNSQRNESLFHVSMNEMKIKNVQITFLSPKKASRILFIDGFPSNITFNNLNVKGLYNLGGISTIHSKFQARSHSNVNIENCIFSEAFNKDKTPLFFLKNLKEFNIRNITLENISHSDNLIRIIYEGIELKRISFNECHFHNISQLNDQCGAIDFGISGIPIIIFNGCTFSRCSSKQGVYSYSYLFLSSYQYSSSALPVNNTKFCNCLFEGKYSEENHGLKPKEDISVRNCTFLNIRNRDSGAINLDSKTHKVQNISNCLFDNCFHNIVISYSKENNVFRDCHFRNLVYDGFLLSAKNERNISTSFFLENIIFDNISKINPNVKSGGIFIMLMNNNSEISDIIVTNAEFKSISYLTSFGAIESPPFTFTIFNSTFERIGTEFIPIRSNSSIHMLTIEACTFNNSEYYNAICSIEKNITVTIEETHFLNIILILSCCNFEISHCCFTECSYLVEEIDDMIGSAIIIRQNIEKSYILYTTFSDCGKYGFAIRIMSNPVVIENSSISTFDTDHYHGGIFINTEGNIEVIGCTITGISTPHYGEVINAIRVESTKENKNFLFSNINISKCSGSNLGCFSIKARDPSAFTFAYINVDHSSDLFGSVDFSGYASDNDKFIFHNCEFFDNNLNDTGCIDLSNNRKAMKFKFDSCIFLSNINFGNGGLFYEPIDQSEFLLGNKILEFDGCIFKNNTGIGNAGVFLIQLNISLIIKHSSFESNTAVNGSIIYFTPPSLDSKPTIEITNSLFKQNTAIENGGVIFSDVGHCITIQGCTFSQNRANKSGNSIFIRQIQNISHEIPKHEIKIESCTFSQGLNKNKNESSQNESSVEKSENPLSDRNTIYIQKVSNQTIRVSKCEFSKLSNIGEIIFIDSNPKDQE
ncbi:hypothetical protein TRFO_42663 [Tritrichomonas foetus]|uniref:Right handed beta helix domain-containing protein n=1 Tax=Tritrichomonas foetus TaxID=1144522 RepID=A0A1J4KVE7_9EUKA|nr:hypothetical protein TRFO_42663 [Tritrichomonas foetus]|eukprot:OHT15211.1 hypothetical protein TRFO_42663 [Tritrichomonas foetus]